MKDEVVVDFSHSSSEIKTNCEENGNEGDDRDETGP